jgi:hypothetical protein
MARLNRELGVPYCSAGYYVVDPHGEHQWCADIRVATWEVENKPDARIVTADEWHARHKEALERRAKNGMV